MPSSPLYDADFFAWANEQDERLRSGDYSTADVEHIADEIESLARAEKRELVSRLAVLLHHLLMWRRQSTFRCTSGRLSIANFRDQLCDHLSDNPSLKSKLDEPIVTAYRYARRDAAKEFGLDEAEFPSVCPWSYEQMTSEAILAE